MKKILLADDDDVVRNLVSVTLEGSKDYELYQARNGNEALEIARRETPDLIFLDVNMPGLDGFEVCRQLKSDPKTQHITIAMLSALGQEANREEGRRAGADDYFTKPFSPLALLRKVEEVLQI